MTHKKTFISYEDIVQKALRGVVHDVIGQVCRNGLPGNHHLYITFQTRFPGVKMASYLKERHPDEVTIVLQYQFWDLVADQDAFSVTLSFNDVRENLTIPYEAITGFVDPSVKFGLQFTPAELPQEDQIGSVEEETNSLEHESSPKASSKQKNKAIKNNKEDVPNVVSLDSFRNKKS